ncbi:vascular endothelial growth factor C-like isoform X2 [Brienomyrus brachyistius]|uniref:vascular endothelial growth factor C-like isoform X2 n=1 Tax=Brienomyrus brachyistius TaxID=42636 RepID=UPI0020B2463B|nr:vascular endothelial growth factor C-like isoform X2 [Brienomyrus brachyistius]
MWILSFALWILGVSNLTHGSHTDEPTSKPPQVSSLDELLETLYPEYSLVQDCLRRRTHAAPWRGHASPDDMWGDPREMALYKFDGTFEVIMQEIQLTMCRPREVCLEVSKEYPESTSNFYLPRCVSVHRCGGCCNHEALYCGNTSHSLINKTLVELSPPRMERSVIMVTFVNHTACECQGKRPLHSIIRRAAASHRPLCSVPDVPCDPGWEWNAAGCQCVPVGTHPSPAPVPDPLDAALLALCGPNKVLDEGRCECVCENGLTETSCGAGWRLDAAACECVCDGQPAPGTCPPSQRWEPELCGCVCRAACPRSQPLNPDTCLCQCRESERSCLLQGKKFNRENCSCYRLPCRSPRRKCPSGHYYSPSVCQCVPNYMRSGEWNWGGRRD